MTTSESEGDRLELSEEERLSPEQYAVLRQKGTDAPFSGEYTHPGRAGVFRCAACGVELFDAEDQFDSGSGWPSFTRPVEDSKVERQRDVSHGMVRTEALCSRCGGHLGHVFDDGPGPEGERWCINSTSITVEK